MIRVIRPWSALLLVGFFCVAVIGQETANPPPSFSLYAWPYQQAVKPRQAPGGKIDPVRYLPELRYRDGNETHSVNLLPGRQSKRLTFSGESPITLFRVLPETNATEISAVLHLAPGSRDVLFVLYPKDVAGRSYGSFPINRTSVAQIAGAGIIANLTREKLLVDVNGAKKQLAPREISPFRMQRTGEDFTRFQVSAETQNGWTVVHSTKRFLSRQGGTVLLLSPSSSRSSRAKPKVVTLSPPR